MNAEQVQLMERGTASPANYRPEHWVKMEFVLRCRAAAFGETKSLASNRERCLSAACRIWRVLSLGECAVCLVSETTRLS